MQQRRLRALILKKEQFSSNKIIFADCSQYNRFN